MQTTVTKTRAFPPEYTVVVDLGDEGFQATFSHGPEATLKANAEALAANPLFTNAGISNPDDTPGYLS